MTTHQKTTKRLRDHQRQAVAAVTREHETRAAEKTSSPRAHQLSQPAEKIIKQLRDYQLKAVAAIDRELATAPRTTVVMACGTGKTFTSLRAMEAQVAHLESAIVLVLFPSLALIQQTYDEWMKDRARSFEALGFCSTLTGGIDRDSMKAEDLTLANTTDPKKLAAFLNAGGPGLRIVFGTYQSSGVLAGVHGSGHGVRAWDMVIADEAHRTTGDVGSDFATVLYDKIPATSKVFFTATPKTHKAGKGRERDELEIASMDDETIYGKRAFTYSVNQAIKEKVLSNYIVLGIAVTEARVHQLAASNESWWIDGLHGPKTARFITMVAAILHAAKTYDLSRLITFHDSIAAAKAFAHAFPLVAAVLPAHLHPTGQVRASAVSGAMSVAERKTHLEALAATPSGDLTIVANARCLGEGIDVPSLDGIVFTNPKSSPTEVTQCVGRALRKNPDRPDAASIILVPVLLKPGADPELAFRASDFSALYRVIRALGENDPVFEADMLDERRTTAPVGFSGQITVSEASAEIVAAAVGEAAAGSASGEAASVPVPVVGEISGTVVASASGAEPPAPAPTTPHLVMGFIDAEPDEPLTPKETAEREDRNLFWTGEIRTEVVRGSTDGWEEMADRLAEFWKEFGRWPSTIANNNDERQLGIWLGRQRADRNAGLARFTLERQEYLDQVAPGWEGEDQDEKWREAADEVAAFQKEHGRWPRDKAGDADEQRLGRWLSNQRSGRNGGRGEFTPERQAYLDQVAPGWEGEDLDEKWRETADEVAAFRKEHGRWPIQRATDADEQRLGRWLSTQRKGRNGGRAKFTPERQAYLDRVAPGWEGEDRDEKWRETADEVAAFRKEHGKWPSRSATDADEQRLGRWLSTQRSGRNGGRGEFTPERQGYLDQVAPGWEGEDLDEKWRETADEVAAFRKEHGKWPNRKATDAVEQRLGRWLSNQRKGRNGGRAKFTPERQAYLDQVAPGWEGEDLDEKWRETADEVAAFRKEHGKWPSQRATDADEQRLGRWLSNQRSGRNGGRAVFTPERQAYLDQVAPGWEEDRHDTWRTTADKVAAFRAEHGTWPSASASADVDERQLGIWLGKQRGDRKAGRAVFTPERQAYLDQVAPGWGTPDPRGYRKAA